MTTILIPAFGRTYDTTTEALADYDSGKDFQLLETGQYCSKRDEKNLFKRSGEGIIELRWFNSKGRVCFFDIFEHGE